MTESSRTQHLVRLAMFIAIILLQTWIPMFGYINIPPLSITFIHVTVIVATLWLGFRDGMIVGFVWGLNSLIRAYVAPVSPFHTYVLTSPFVSVLPRVLMPLVVGLLIYQLNKIGWNKRLIAAIAGGTGSILNTIFVLGAIVVFQQANYIMVTGVAKEQLFNILGGIVVVNGVPEMIAATIMTPIIYSALSRLKSH